MRIRYDPSPDFISSDILVSCLATMLLTHGVLAAIALVAGVTSHKLYWSRYEFDEQVPRILFAGNLVWLVLTYNLSRESSLLEAICVAALIVSLYTLAVFSSIISYRLYSHPLRRFLGPKWAPLTAWWKVKHIANVGTHYGLINKLHEQYGEVVRTGKSGRAVT